MCGIWMVSSTRRDWRRDDDLRSIGHARVTSVGRGRDNNTTTGHLANNLRSRNLRDNNLRSVWSYGKFLVKGKSG